MRNSQTMRRSAEATLPSRRTLQTTALMSRFFLFGCCLWFLTTTRHIEAYISCQAVPRDRQIAFLKEMTADFTHAELGHLSRDQISTAPQLMAAWSHTPQKSVDKALALEALVKRLVDERSAGNNLVADLTVHDYNCLLEGWAHTGAGSDAAERCEKIVEQMEVEGGLVMPDKDSFKCVLMAWRHADVKHGAHRAQRILEGMIRYYRENPEEHEYMFPDSDCFDIVLQTWSRSGHPKAPEQAESVLALMERLYEATNNKLVKPRTSSFNAVLATWARSRHPKAAERAADLLGFMELLEEHGDKYVIPDASSYCTVMGALGKCKGDPVVAALKTESLLRKVEERYRQDAESIVPDTICFNTAMGCWAKTSMSGSYRRARSILDRQIRLYREGCVTAAPDVFGYTSVIASAAAESGSMEERGKAFNVAFSAFRQMEQNDVQPNHVTFGNMLKACARLLPPASPVRRKWARRLFDECKEAGCVGDMVISRLRESLPLDLFKECMQGYTRNRLPKAWTRNLPPMQNERKHRLTRNPKKKRTTDDHLQRILAQARKA